MDTAVWTSIGVLAAAVLGMIFYLGTRIDNQAARHDARFDTLSLQVLGLGAKVANLTVQVGELLGVIRVQTSRIDGLSGRLDDLSQRMDVQTERIDRLTERMDEHLRRDAS